MMIMNLRILGISFDFHGDSVPQNTIAKLVHQSRGGTTGPNITQLGINNLQQIRLKVM